MKTGQTGLPPPSAVKPLKPCAFALRRKVENLEKLEILRTRAGAEQARTVQP